jgi:hypothetical protein
MTPRQPASRRAPPHLDVVREQQLVQAALVVHCALHLLKRHRHVGARRLHQPHQQLLQPLQLDGVAHRSVVLGDADDHRRAPAVRPRLRAARGGHAQHAKA